MLAAPVFSQLIEYLPVAGFPSGVHQVLQFLAALEVMDLLCGTSTGVPELAHFGQKLWSTGSPSHSVPERSCIAHQGFLSVRQEGNAYLRLRRMADQARLDAETARLDMEKHQRKRRPLECRWVRCVDYRAYEVVFRV